VPSTGGTEKSKIRTALDSCRGAFVGIGVFTAVINVLALTSSLFMLEIYDRVLPSRSVPTLVGLAILTGLLLSIQGILDLIRARVLVRVGASLDKALSRRVYTAIVRLPLRTANRSDGLQPLRDLDSVRSFLSGLGPTALFDLPWIPVYLGIVFSFHALLGTVALAGALVLVVLTLLTEILTRSRSKAATNFIMPRHSLAETGRRNAEVLVSMGMMPRMADHWCEANDAYLKSQQGASDVSGGFGAVSKVVRVMLQSGVLGVGAYLVIHQEATAGIIIAGSILTARAFAPVDLAIAHWKGFVAARQGWQRLAKMLELLPESPSHLPLPAPRAGLAVEGVSAAPPGAERPVVVEVSFSLVSGQGVGIIGPSAAGKSSLARLLVGVWRPVRGKIRLDRAALEQWDSEALGRHIGYLPQDVELFAGTVAQNIARFDPAASPEMVVAAAQAAGAHNLIVGLREGYDTELGEHGLGLSAGQQQRIGLARALYGDPFLVVLDEPNSNLDAEGEIALTDAILGVRARDGIVVVIAHRPSALAGVDTVLVMNQGRMQAFGPKDEVLSKVARAPSHAPAPLRIVPEGGSRAS
jgi:ATP-binding cassette subfamily C protein